jgi:hypothetical protein
VHPPREFGFSLEAVHCGSFALRRVVEWDASKVKQMIWQGLLVYTRIAWAKTPKVSKREAIYDDVLAKFDTTWGDNNLLYVP